MRFIHSEREVDPNAYTGGLKVICAGLPRCATSTLANVLEYSLGFGPCMHMAELAPHTYKMQICHAALIETNKAKRQAMLHKLFDGYASTSDFPGMAFIPDFIEMYPDAKVILNKRASGEVWARSIKNTLKFFASDTYHAITYLISTDRWIHKLQCTYQRNRQERDGVNDWFTVEGYDKHNAMIRATAKKFNKELLEFEPSMGFAPLCDFLEVPMPLDPKTGKAKTELPRLNDEREIKILTAVLIVRGLLAWTALLGAPVFAWWGLQRFGGTIENLWTKS